MSLSLKKNKQSGFTLVELMVVMAIIAILATAGLSAYTGYLKKARDTIRAKDMQTIYRMLLEYNTMYGGIPVTHNASRNQQGYIDTNAGGWDYSSQPTLNPTFMSFLVTSGIANKVPIDPINNMSGDMGPAGTYAYKYYCYPGSGLALGYTRESSGQTIYYSGYKNPEFSCL